MTRPEAITAPVVNAWLEQSFAEVRPAIRGSRTDMEQLTVSVYRYGPGSEWETHSHPEDQVTVIVQGGTIEFVVDGEPLVLRPGDVALLPGGVPHSARTGDEEVVSINVWRRRP